MDVTVSGMGERAVARCDALGAAPFSEAEGILIRPYLSEAHRQSLDVLGGWMAAAGMSVRLDPLGNLIGRYDGTDPDAPALLIGSHIDTVHDAGRYDGALGVMLGVECVDHFREAGRRLSFAIEVIAFGDEEGSRFAASMLCSRAVAGEIDETALDLSDATGMSLRQAMVDFGLNPANMAGAARPAGDILAYVEPHIEQGPVLEALNLPIGVVTGIAAQLRLKARFVGQAGHAGTSPMGLRKDAVAAAAAAVLAVEAVCSAAGGEVRGTVGRVLPRTSAYNVIVGEVEIGIDVRAPTREARDAAADEIGRRLRAIAAERGVALDFSVVQDLADCPCDPGLMRLMDEAVRDVGIEPFRLLSGAGHDAMSLSGLAPVAMLFIRCEAGISHNAAEAVAPADVEIAGRALIRFVERLALEAA
jgi:allantoate deiminase